MLKSSIKYLEAVAQLNGYCNVCMPLPQKYKRIRLDTSFLLEEMPNISTSSESLQMDVGLLKF